MLCVNLAPTPSGICPNALQPRLERLIFDPASAHNVGTCEPLVWGVEEAQRLRQRLERLRDKPGANPVPQVLAWMRVSAGLTGDLRWWEAPAISITAYRLLDRSAALVIHQIEKRLAVLGNIGIQVDQARQSFARAIGDAGNSEAT